MTTTQDIVAKLWSLCHVLRDDGITYHEYVTELTFLLFLKMVKETQQAKLLPNGYRWNDLTAKDGVEQLAYYRALLVHLGNEGSGRVGYRRDGRGRHLTMLLLSCATVPPSSRTKMD